MSEWDDAVAKLTDEDWKKIEELNGRIQSYEGSWGETKGGEEIKPGTIQMPFISYAPIVHEFLELWYDKGLIIPFSWSSWDEGSEWYANTDETKYDKLDNETALKLLTAVIRNDRFHEGALKHAFDDGDFPKIINKFVSLRGQ